MGISRQAHSDEFIWLGTSESEFVKEPSVAKVSNPFGKERPWLGSSHRTEGFDKNCLLMGRTLLSLQPLNFPLVKSKAALL